MMDLIPILKSIRLASRELRLASDEEKNRVLEHLKNALITKKSGVLSQNAKDLSSLEKSVTSAFRDRLFLTSERIDAMAESLSEVSLLSDPIGEVVEKKILKNGLRVSRERVPLGVIFMIFESRPNIAIEAFSLAFKAGNAMILRGGKESIHTTSALYAMIQESLASQGFSRNALWGITDPDRRLIKDLLDQKDWIDIVVPRGGDALIDFVMKNSKIPIIKNDRGLCHVYVHEDADLEMAKNIVVNAKTQRPGVCNAMETLLVHHMIASKFLPELFSSMGKVDWFGCPETLKILAPSDRIHPALKENWNTEYLDLKMNCRIVTSLEQAIEHIEEHGSHHSESVVTCSERVARKFQSSIDAAVLYWNASTRFTDGFELGLGGELGISTQKLHVRGPVGLRELTSIRWVIDGEGQVRK